MVYYLIFEFLNFISTFLVVIISVAFLTLIERKILASMQKRRGPNVIGFFGLFQPIADGFKLVFKEHIVPYQADKILFLLAPILTFMLSLISWSIIPLSDKSELVGLGPTILLILSVSSLSVYGIILSGWASNSKYAFFGALRSAAQMISYEVSLSLVVIPVILLSGSLNLVEIVWVQQQTVWFIIPLFPAAIIFLISSLAETNRSPFDLPEAEGELVAGFNVEYSAICFAMFFLAEYANILLMSVLFVLLFLGGWTLPFVIITSTFWMSIVLACKMLFIIFIFIWVRASFPRFRFDQLMYLGWKVFLPLTTSYFLFLVSIVMFSKIYLVFVRIS